VSIISQQNIDDPGTVLHWYDFLCPFCYIAQNRNAILVWHGVDVIELPFQAHPNIPHGGILAPSRKGWMYEVLEHEAREAGLVLHWPPRLPNTRLALGAAEWVRQYQPREFPDFHVALYAAHFALGEDLGDSGVIYQHARVVGIDLTALHRALSDGSALKFVSESEQFGRRYGVQGTPAWLLNGQLFSGLPSAGDFERRAHDALEAWR
jgi:predicted DsbA family dithiol-disulfide isomerase